MRDTLTQAELFEIAECGQKGLHRPWTVTIWPQQEYPLWRRTINYLAAFFVMILAGCGEANTEEETECRTAYYGDSIAWQVEHSDHAPDFDFYAFPGMSLLGTHPNFPDLEIDKSYCRIFIGLGTNQASDHAAELRSLQEMLDGIEDRAICVLPMTKYGIPVEPQRSMLQAHCPRYIDPIQHGVYPLSVDQIHLSRTDGGENIKQYAALLR